MKSIKKLVLVGLVLLTSVMVLVGCKNDSVPEVPHEHTFAEEWNHNGTHHWKDATCEHTGEVGQKAAHTFVNEICSICKYSRIPEGYVFVPGGTIKGALPAWLDESAKHHYKGVFIEGRTVAISGFYMGKYEVTQEEYASVMANQTVKLGEQEYQLESNPSFCTEDSTTCTLFAGDVQGKRPVEGVTWYDAVWYCNALSEKAGLEKAYDIEVTEVTQASGKTGYAISEATVTLKKDANGYRLPTEAEWEYAARGGNPGAEDWNYTFSGSDKAEGTNYNDSKNAGLDAVGWYCYNNITGKTGDEDVTTDVSGKGTHQVGKKEKNSLGIYDMSGNVLEWCYDWAGTINTGEEVDPQGASSGSNRVYRGGSVGNRAYNASVSYRGGIGPSERYVNLGFRVVCPSSK